MVAGEVCLDEAKIGRNQASKASWQPAPASLSGKVVHGSKTGPVRLASGPSLGIIWGMSGECDLTRGDRAGELFNCKNHRC